MRKKNILSRRKFIGSGLAGAAALAVGGYYKFLQSRPPNVVMIMADDMPPGDLSCYYNREFKTPNIDRLAAQGVLFTDAYSAVPACQPTRVSFMTGSYPQRYEIGNGSSPDEDRLSVPDVNIASVLLKNGYDTALAGKWHLGSAEKSLPLSKGFNEYFGIVGSDADYFKQLSVTKSKVLMSGNRMIEKPGDRITDWAVDFIVRPREKPFFLSLNFTAPHTRSRASYIEIIKNLDDSVGKVLAALYQKGLKENTLLIFTSDNGGASFGNLHDFKGKKGTCWEGGIRVPTIVRWPKRLDAGQIAGWPIITMDITATIVDATKTSSSGLLLDGKSILKGENAFEGRKLFWRWRDYRAVRFGSWKYLRKGNNEHLYDIEKNHQESRNLLSENPKMLAELKGHLNDWESQMLPVPLKFDSDSAAED